MSDTITERLAEIEDDDYAGDQIIPATGEDANPWLSILDAALAEKRQGGEGRMRCLTIKQPWAWAILHGKPVENRAWQRPFRGPLAIHAGKGWDWDGADSPLVQRAWQKAGLDVDCLQPKRQQMTLGAVVAVADLVDICSDSAPLLGGLSCECGPWASRGQYHWRLDNVRPLAEPVPCRGALGLWTLPEDVEAAVVAQLGERTNA